MITKSRTRRPGAVRGRSKRRTPNSRGTKRTAQARPRGRLRADSRISGWSCGSAPPRSPPRPPRAFAPARAWEEVRGREHESVRRREAESTRARERVRTGSCIAVHTVVDLGLAFELLSARGQESVGGGERPRAQEREEAKTALAQLCTQLSRWIRSLKLWVCHAAPGSTVRWRPSLLWATAQIAAGGSLSADQRCKTRNGKWLQLSLQTAGPAAPNPKPEPSGGCRTFARSSRVLNSSRLSFSGTALSMITPWETPTIVDESARIDRDEGRNARTHGANERTESTEPTRPIQDCQTHVMLRAQCFVTLALAVITSSWSITCI